jgi:hypothetical protein
VVVVMLNKVASTCKSNSKNFCRIITVIAGEPEGSWLAGGQQEGLQYSGGSAWCSVAQRSRR